MGAKIVGIIFVNIGLSVVHCSGLKGVVVLEMDGSWGIVQGRRTGYSLFTVGFTFLVITWKIN